MLCASCGEKIEIAEIGTRCPKCEGPTVLAGKYRLLAILGRGANGVTYEAVRIEDDLRVAVKEMPLGTAESVKALELFEREAKVLKQLHHPAIPRHHDDFAFGEGKSHALYLVQELIAGRTIAAEAKEKRYEPREVWAIVSELCGVLTYLHAKSPPVVHRDIKPANVMRRENGKLVLIDFGSVRDAVKTGGGSTIAGTFGYMAPEQLAGRASPASDLYGLGALACALLARKEADEMLDDEGHVDVRAHTHLDDGSLALIDELLATSAKDRPSTAGEVKSRARKLAERKAEPENHEEPEAKADSEPPKHETKNQRKKRLRRERKAEEDKVAKAEASKQTEEPTKGEDAGMTEGEAVAVAIVEKRWFPYVAMGFLPLVAGIVIIYGLLQDKPNPKAAAVMKKAASAPAPPELYARAIVADVSGDGVEDVITAVGVDQLPADVNPNDPNVYGAKEGRFSAFVQAISGATGSVLYTLGDYGRTYSSLGTKAEDRTRTVLALRDKKLVVARVAAASTTFEIFDASNGKSLRKATAGALSGAACDANAGVWFESTTASEGVMLDVGSGAVTRVQHPSECSGAASATIAAAPTAEGITNRAQWKPFFAEEVKIQKGQYAGVTAHAREGLAVLIDSKKQPAAPASGPTVSYGDVSAMSGGADNSSVSVVGVDMATGAIRWERSLAALGLVKETADRVDIHPMNGPILFLKGEGGIVALFPKTGLARFRLPLPEHTTLAQYTLSSRSVVLHVFDYNDAVFGFLSKRLVSRNLFADFTVGKYERSFPEGPLAPHVDPPKPPFDASGYSAVSGCTCPVPDDGADAAAAPFVQLLYYIRSTTESAGHKRFGAMFAFDVDASPFPLPHYDEKRERIAPPRTLEGDVPMAIACGQRTVVFAWNKLATAWSLDTKDETWTVDLPRPRGEPVTTIGGAATVRCARGSISRGIVRLPALDGKEMKLSLDKGAPL